MKSVGRLRIMENKQWKYGEIHIEWILQFWWSTEVTRKLQIYVSRTYGDNRRVVDIYVDYIMEFIISHREIQSNNIYRWNNHHTKFWWTLSKNGMSILWLNDKWERVD